MLESKDPAVVTIVLNESFVECLTAHHLLEVSQCINYMLMKYWSENSLMTLRNLCNNLKVTPPDVVCVQIYIRLPTVF